MANIKNIVQVMNFHSLIRVDKAKREANKYFGVEDEINRLLYSITNNKNLSKNGPYFEVKEASADTVIDSYDTYAVDIGYPSDNFVSNFTIKNDDSWFKYSHA